MTQNYSNRIYRLHALFNNGDPITRDVKASRVRCLVFIMNLLDGNCRDACNLLFKV